jgi:hypothetical protein
MTGISLGTKVNVEIQGQLLPGVIVSHHFASIRMYDLYTLRIAEYNQQAQAWRIVKYGPVPSHRLTMRETHVPLLDRDERRRRRLPKVPTWAWEIRR